MITEGERKMKRKQGDGRTKKYNPKYTSNMILMNHPILPIGNAIRCKKERKR
jgi:hypothetical protein